MTKYELNSDSGSDPSAMEILPQAKTQPPKRNYRRSKKTADSPENLPVGQNPDVSQEPMAAQNPTNPIATLHSPELAALAPPLSKTRQVAAEAIPNEATPAKTPNTRASRTPKTAQPSKASPASKPKATEAATPRRRAPKKTANLETPNPENAEPTLAVNGETPLTVAELTPAIAVEATPKTARATATDKPPKQTLLLPEISQAAPSFSPSIAHNTLPIASHIVPAGVEVDLANSAPRSTAEPLDTQVFHQAEPQAESKPIVLPSSFVAEAAIAPKNAPEPSRETSPEVLAPSSENSESAENPDNSETPKPAKRRRSRRSSRHRPDGSLAPELAPKRPASENLILILDPNKHPHALETIIKATPRATVSEVMELENASVATANLEAAHPQVIVEVDIPAAVDTEPLLPPEPEASALEIPEEAESLDGTETTPEVPARKSRSARRRKASQKAKLLAQAEQKQAELNAEIETEPAPKAEPILDEPTELDGESSEYEAAEANKRTKKTPASLRKMLISVLEGDQVEVVLTEDGKLVEYYVEMQHHAKIRGNIYKGTISNIDVNLQAAFVNYGKAKNGFLQIDEVHPEYYLQVHEPAKGRKYPPIQKVLKPGQEVLVQVVKEPTGNKGAFLTTWASLAGRFLVLTPGQEQIGISRKVEEGDERNRLREMIKGLDPGPGLGVIVRTVSAGTSKTTLQKDLNFLKRLWKDIRKRATTEKAPSLIYQEPDLAPRAIRDYLSDDITEVWVDNEKTSEAIREMAALLFPRKHDLVHLFTDPRKTMWERFGLLGQLEEVHAREVIMPSGGRLVFDQTEALMAVDINSGKISGKGNFESMSHRTNMEAANIIAHQLRLRDIGGQIVIDFIEMRDPEHCRLVEKELRNAMKIDRARHDISKISAFGLMEIVRQRTGTSAISITLEPCPHCKGTGQRRNLEWRAVQTLRDIHKAMRAAKAAEQINCIYPLEAELAMYILNHKKERLCFLEKDFNLTLIIKAE